MKKIVEVCNWDTNQSGDPVRVPTGLDERGLVIAKDEESTAQVLAEFKKGETFAKFEPFATEENAGKIDAAMDEHYPNGWCLPELEAMVELMFRNREFTKPVVPTAAPSRDREFYDWTMAHTIRERRERRSNDAEYEGWFVKTAFDQRATDEAKRQQVPVGPDFTNPRLYAFAQAFKANTTESMRLVSGYRTVKGFNNDMPIEGAAFEKLIEDCNAANLPLR